MIPTVQQVPSPMPVTRPGAQRNAPSHRVIVLAGLIIGVGASYANSLRTPFVFDDIAAIQQNPSLGTWRGAVFPPAGLSVSGRPLSNLSLALNYAVSGTAPWSYHLLNALLHVACGALVLGILGRCFVRGRQTAGAAALLAALITAIWLLHPLQTATVTYVMQRTELLGSLCYLGAVYAAVRAFECRRGEASPSTPRTRAGWLALSVLSTALGGFAKEIIVTVPVAILALDVTLYSGRATVALRRDPHYYLALAVCWGIPGGLALTLHGRDGSAGWSAGVGVGAYAATQAIAVWHYLRLAIWPSRLVFDYGADLIDSPLATCAGAAALVSMPVLFVWRGHRSAVAALAFGWYLLLLLPTSSVIPVATQVIAEHRVYLAVLGPIMAAIVMAHRSVGRRVNVAVVAGVAGLMALTVARNRTYAAVATLWRDTAAKVPANSRAWYNLGLAEIDLGQTAQAEAAFTRAVQLTPDHVAAQDRLAQLLADTGRVREAIGAFEAVARAHPTLAAAHVNLGNAYLRVGDVAAARSELARAVQLDPASGPAHLAYGTALAQAGTAEPAAREFAAAIRCTPGLAAAHYNHGLALSQLGRYEEALAEFDTASRLDPSDPAARNNASRLRTFLRPQSGEGRP